MPGESRDGLSYHISRRAIFVGAAASALTVAAPSVSARGRDSVVPIKADPMGAGETGNESGESVMEGVRRYMAAGVSLLDGRVLVAGGYDRPMTGDQRVMPLRSAVILDPGSGAITHAASMSVSRARHAAAVLPDGRVVVVGGIGMSPIASIEIYDPRTNEWEIAGALSAPRYDHIAVAAGWRICVVGGSWQSLRATSETLFFSASSAAVQP